MSGSSAIKCAVSGSDDTFNPWRALEQSEVHVVDLALEPDSVVAVRRADFVLAFMDQTARAVLLDVGIAIALKKPMLIVARSSEDVPVRLLAYPLLLTGGLTYEDFVLQIRSFAAAFLPKEESQRASSPDRVRVREQNASSNRNSTTVASELDRRMPSREQFHSDYEYQVAEMLTRAGAVVVGQVREPDALTTPDLAASFVGLGPIFSTVLVELSGRKTNLVAKKSALRAAMDSRGLRLGVLVTLEEVEDPDPEPGILVVSLLALETLVARGQVFSELRGLRNRLAHQAS